MERSLSGLLENELPYSTLFHITISLHRLAATCWFPMKIETSFTIIVRVIFAPIGSIRFRKYLLSGTVIVHESAHCHKIYLSIYFVSLLRIASVLLIDNVVIEHGDGNIGCCISRDLQLL